MATAAAPSTAKAEPDGREAWETPLCLVDNTKDSEFKVVPATLAKLRKIKHPVVVVSIVGPYRSGKSYLMNRLAGYKKGFEIGTSIQAKTKGIWIWCLKHPDKTDQQLLLLDTEGLGDVEKVSGTQNDIMLFLLTTLFSCCLVYNSRGTIDTNAINNLKFVSELAEKLKISEDTESAEDEDAILGQYFPQFVWVVRDFTLELKFNGQDITSDAYLENALTLNKGASKSAQEYNMHRRCIRRYFPNRKCFVFPQPLSDSSQMTKLSELTAENLDIKFLQLTKKFIDHVIATTQPKSIGGIVMDGAKFSSLVSRYTENIVSGKIPSIETIVRETSADANTNLVKECVDSYRATMATLQLPSNDVAALTTHHEACVKKIKDDLKSRSVILDEDENSVVNQLMAGINKELEEIKVKNETASLNKCKDLLKTLTDELHKNINNNVYNKVGGFSEYEKDFAEVCKKYMMTPDKGVMATKALQDEIQGLAPMVKAIVYIDKALAEEQRKREEQKLKDKIAELEKENARRKDEEAQRRIEEQERRQKEFERAMSERFEEQKRLHAEEIKQLLRYLTAERDRLKKEGASEDCETMEDLIGGLERGGGGQQQQPRSPQSLTGGSRRKPYYIYRP